MCGKRTAGASMIVQYVMASAVDAPSQEVARARDAEVQNRFVVGSLESRILGKNQGRR